MAAAAPLPKFVLPDPAPAFSTANGVLTFEMLEKAIRAIEERAGKPEIVYFVAHPAQLRFYNSLSRQTGLLYDAEIAS